MTESMATRGLRAFRHSLLLSLAIVVFAVAGTANAGLIINELFNGSNSSSDYVEFLVTSDMTLAELDGIWFGDSKGNTKGIDHENSFNATQIIANVGAFNSTSDVLRAGTLITIGGSSVATDFTYNPNSNDPTDSDAWNITLGVGQGFDTSSGSVPFELDQQGDVVWLSTSQPSSGTGTTDFISAIAYDSAPGDLALEVQALALAGDPNFQLVTGSDFDGKFDKDFSLSNSGGASLSFGETPGGSLGEQNGGTNQSFTYDLRAVPEPSAIIPCVLVLACGIFFGWKRTLLKPVEA